MVKLTLRECHIPLASPGCKLLRSNRPQAKFRLKSSSNRLLIKFFNPKSESESELSRPNQFQQLKKRLKSSKSIDFNLKWLIYIKNGQKGLNFDTFNHF